MRDADRAADPAGEMADDITCGYCTNSQCELYGCIVLNIIPPDVCYECGDRLRTGEQLSMDDRQAKLVGTPPYEATTEALWRLAEAAQKAANDPERANINEVKDAFRQVERTLAAYYFARDKALSELTEEQKVNR